MKAMPLILSLLCAQLPLDEDPRPTSTANEAFWEARSRQQSAAAAEMVLAGDPWTIIALRLEGRRFVVWQEPEFLSKEALPLNADWLDLVRDGTPMPDIRGKATDEISESTWAAYKLFNQAVIQAF